MGRINTAFKILLSGNIRNFFSVLYANIYSKRIEGFNKLRVHFSGKKALEIGGPSTLFGKYGTVPVYRDLSVVDGCNFSNSTIWEGEIEGGNSYLTEGKVGKQFILEATSLSAVSNEEYDVVLTSHCLEHVANPIKAINEWLRVLKADGILLIVVPNKEYCFDHKRPFTKFEHILKDFSNDVKENDTTHLEEVLKLHDLSRDIPAGSPIQFKERCLKNEMNRAMHHHVFSESLFIEIFNHLGVEVEYFNTGRDVVVAVRK